MGRIICPNGASVVTDKVAGHIPFEYLLKFIKSESWTDDFRARCIQAVAEVGLFGYREDISRYVTTLFNETESPILRDACKTLMSKHKIKRNKKDRKNGKTCQGKSPPTGIACAAGIA